jgi:hypothetical protein
MSQLPAKVVSIPNERQVQEIIKNNPRLVDETQVRSIINEGLSLLANIEYRLDRLENQGFLGRVWGSITGSTNREMISLMRDLSQTQQTTIKLVLTLAVYHAQNVKVMNEILDELDRAKGLHTRTASHIEFLYEQVQLIRDIHGKRKPPARHIRRWMLSAALIGVTALFIFLWVQNMA